ncbi:hypothetical protein ON010_g6478 [Phytophthora cinnamomi]|nr:hypothetical protein ON010_g6478 [Phytophthora cinnamomi]
MAELATREFISQWAYDHEQDRNDARDEAAMQCIGADRVAELLRQRHEHRLDRNFDVMDFETRAAAIDVHFLQAPRCRSPESGRKSPQPVRPSRVRPQSASLARRCGDNSSSRNEISARQRPQSAKYRSELARRDPNVGHVDWNAHAQEKPSKWREMLVYGPEFKQLTLRKLELETYELLYKTLDRQEIDVKPTRRRRKRANTDNTAKPNDYSTAPACGSGLHLARSRKNRQQEHDRRMMLGRGRQNSRRGEQEKPKGGGQDKQAIQDKTRRRNKLLIKKKSQRQLRECQPDDRTAKREKHPEEPCANRTVFVMFSTRQ